MFTTNVSACACYVWCFFLCTAPHAAYTLARIGQRRRQATTFTSLARVYHKRNVHNCTANSPQFVRSCLVRGLAYKSFVSILNFSNSISEANACILWHATSKLYTHAKFFILKFLFYQHKIKICIWNIFNNHQLIYIELYALTRSIMNFPLNLYSKFYHYIIAQFKYNVWVQ